MHQISASASALHVGHLRTHQEDGVFVDDEAGVYAVFDGMGGSSSGWPATEFLIGRLGEAARAAAGGPAAFAAELDAFNDALMRFKETDPRHMGMGAAGVIMRSRPGWCDVSHMGDSRGYLWREGAFVARTMDDSLVNEYVRLGLVSTADVRDFPYRNVIVRAFGAKEGVELHHQSWPVAPGDRVLLCSDGVYDELPDGVLERVLAEHPDVEDAAARLLELVLAGDARDNLSLVVLEVGEAPAVEASEGDAWGELRGRLHGAERVDWRRAVEAIEAFREAGGEVTGEVVEYVRGVLRGWEGARTTPVAWLNDALGEVAQRPELALCEVWELPVGWSLVTAGVPEVWPEALFEGLRVARLRDDALSAGQLAEVMRRLDAAGLETSEVSWANVPVATLMTWRDEGGWSSEVAARLDEEIEVRADLGRQVAESLRRGGGG
jgi:protein phosphatase